MGKPTIYGISSSRAFRSIWAIEECGVDYEHVGTSFRGDAQAPEYLEVNPNGRIPALKDGDMTLFESMAINMYLARTYAPQLIPADSQGEAKTWQWSVWGISEIEPLQMQIVVQKFFTPDEKKNDKVVRGATKGLDRPLSVLNDTLSKQPYLLGQEFTLADLNLAGVMELLNMIQFDLSQYAHVERWLGECRGRDSYARAKAV